MSQTGYSALVAGVVLSCALSSSSRGEPDGCYASTNMMCCDISPEFRIFCSLSPTGYCTGQVYMSHNTITPVQVPANPSGWTDQSFFVPPNQVYRCEYHPPVCDVLSPSGCSISQGIELMYCVGLLPDEENGQLCDDL